MEQKQTENNHKVVLHVEPIDSFREAEIGRLSTSMTRVVSVLASFDTKGNIKPVYVRLENESFKIYQSVCHSYGQVLHYMCTIQTYGCTKEIKLIFHVRERCWTLEMGH